MDRENVRTLKLYYPVTVNCYERDRYGDLDEYPTELSPDESAAYLPEVLAQIGKEQLDGEEARGLMEYYHQQDAVDRKIRSARPSAEVMDGNLHGVAVCLVDGELTAEELDAFKDYWSGQMSDGWGEGFEQRLLRCKDGREIAVSYWSPDSGWEIRTADEMRRALEPPEAAHEPMDIQFDHTQQM